MPSATLYSNAGEQSGSVDLPEGLFGSPVHEHVLYETIKCYLANQRQGTHKTKNRHEVAGQRTKMYRQKGTGRARAGSSTAGNRVGGGRIFGPRPRDHHYSIPAKMRRLALKSALSDRAGDSDVYVVEDLELDAPSTKAIAKLLQSMGLADRKVLLVSPAADTNLVKSCRNLQGAEVRPANELNAYEVLHSDAVVLERSALGTLEEVFGE